MDAATNWIALENPDAGVVFDEMSECRDIRINCDVIMKASYDKIRSQIEDAIESSKCSIKVCVAWFTSKELLGALLEMAERGRCVEIIISDHVQNGRLNFDQLLKNGGTISMIATRENRFLHHKFAIFDEQNIIAGSYNWTNSAELYNYEFVVQSNDINLLKQFNIVFDRLKKIAIPFDKSGLNDSREFHIDKKDEQLMTLEEELENQFHHTIMEANKLDARIDSGRVLNFIHTFGAVGAAKRLINRGAENLQSGLLKLWEIHRLDLSFESIILQDNYRVLFDETTLNNAHVRLTKLT